MNSRDALVSNGAVVHVLDAALEFFQDEVHATAPRQQ